MSTYLRKCIDITPNGVLRPGAFNSYEVLREESWWPALRRTTSFLRLWADWPSLQQDPAGVGVGASAENLASLDRQIAAATGDGLQVILLPYRYPRWLNGMAAIVPNSPEDDLFFPEDRVSRFSAYADWRTHKIVDGKPAEKPAYKAHEYRLPADGFGLDSAWAGFVRFLIDRYVDHDAHGTVAAIETVNEPNLQLWPQRSAIDSPDLQTRFGAQGTSFLVPPLVARMMVTLDALAGSRPQLTLLAPSTSDSDTNTTPRATILACATPFVAPRFAGYFVPPLLDELDALGFRAGDQWVWAYHNYSDVERDQNHVAYLRRLLADRAWAGRRLDGGPELWCTEGGCRLTGVRARFGRGLTSAAQRELQAKVLIESVSRHHYPKGAGAGVGMLTQYTTYADPNFDDGLLDHPDAGGAPRPALKAWSDLPEYLPPVDAPADWRPQA